ncbi:MAG: hypothetical protein P0S96_00135 [Simkaniaceae bacterium]|nr:hypothetical protein [Candidatus Sacchlamyda saccharinae]
MSAIPFKYNWDGYLEYQVDQLTTQEQCDAAIEHCKQKALAERVKGAVNAAFYLGSAHFIKNVLADSKPPGFFLSPEAAHGIIFLPVATAVIALVAFWQIRTPFYYFGYASHLNDQVHLLTVHKGGLAS